jgi:hypothetical protein
MSYEITRGSACPLLFYRDRLELKPAFATKKYDVIPGVSIIGRYARMNRFYPVESFLYYKNDDQGNPEVEERAIIRVGFGRGVHPGHLGQQPSLYLIGIDFARVDSVTGELGEWIVEDNDFVQPKHFSVDCIEGGTKGAQAVLANS